MTDTDRQETPPEAPAQQQAMAFFAFVEAPAFRRWALWGLAGLCVVLFAIELVLPAKLHSDATRIPGKYAAIGFAGVCLAAIAGWGLSVLRRSPDYYGEAGDRFPEADESVAEWRAEERGR